MADFLARPESNPAATDCRFCRAGEWIIPDASGTNHGAKLENVAEVIRHALTPESSGVLGLAEVEDGRMVRDLLRAIGDPQLAAAEPPIRRGDGSDVVLSPPVHGVDAQAADRPRTGLRDP